MIHLHFRDIKEIFFIRPIVLRSLTYRIPVKTEEKQKKIVKTMMTTGNSNIPASNRERGRRYGI